MSARIIRLPNGDYVRQIRCNRCGAWRYWAMHWCPECDVSTGATLPATGIIEAYRTSQVRVRKYKVKIMELGEIDG